jgi:hypothetical protein
VYIRASRLAACGLFGRVHVGVDRARLHDVDGDAARPQVAGQPAREAPPPPPSLIAYTAPPGNGHPVGVDAADRDDAAARPVMWLRRRLGRDEHRRARWSATRRSKLLERLNSSIGFANAPTPALFTRMSRRPKALHRRRDRGLATAAGVGRCRPSSARARPFRPPSSLDGRPRPPCALAADVGDARRPRRPRRAAARSRRRCRANRR